MGKKKELVEFLFRVENQLCRRVWTRALETRKFFQSLLPKVTSGVDSWKDVIAVLMGLQLRRYSLSWGKKNVNGEKKRERVKKEEERETNKALYESYRDKQAWQRTVAPVLLQTEKSGGWEKIE